ncbi:MAG: SMC-Scp complex subunit ScpB [Synergistaceae bacterium]|jgi:segregation and condensation protein B|nr:SMC-Scp complex subunit ScpB [Synergistaceae bacterium]
MSKFTRKANSTETLSVLAAQIEAVLFLAASPVAESEMKAVFGVGGQELAGALKELEEHLASGHGLILKSLAGGWLLETNPHFAEVLSLFRDTSQRGRIKLSKAAVETLSVVAYNQPVTRSDVEDLRGVRCERVIETLLSHGLIRISGRKKASGSPLLYRTTSRFLDIFGLEAIADLPSLEELEELGAAPENVSGEDNPPTETVETGGVEVESSFEAEGSFEIENAFEMESSLEAERTEDAT